MKQILKIIRNTVFSLWSVFYCLIAVAIIFAVSYMFGHPILDGRVFSGSPMLIGNDSSFALSLVSWFEKFYPQFPFWYPYQGMGVSLLYSYPMSTTFLLIIIKRLSSLSTIEVFRIMSFFTFPLTASGIYLFAWSRLKNQTIGLISAVFFLLSQASWLFQTLHGIFAQSFSFVTIAPAFLFFDLFLERIVSADKKNTLSLRLYFVLTVTAVGLTYFAHVVTGTMVTITLLLWGFLQFTNLGVLLRSPVLFIQRSIRGLILAGVVVILALGLTAFWLVPFNTYTALANREGLNTRNLEQVRQESLQIPTLLGLGVMGEGEYRYDFFFFAAPVLFFFIVGTVMSFVLKNKKVQMLSIITLFFILLTVIPIYFPFIASVFLFFFTAVYFRGLIPALILLPVVAAWGAWSIPASLFIYPYRHLTKKHRKTGTISRFGNYALGIITAGVTLVLSAGAVILIQHSPPTNQQYKGTYKYQFQPYGPSLSADFSDFMNYPIRYTQTPHPVNVSKAGLESAKNWAMYLNSVLLVDKNTIMDVSPYAAGGEIMQGVGLVKENRFINLYHYYASLIHGMWGYQAGVFFGKEPLYKNTKLLSELTDWYGIKYAVLTPEFDPFEKYNAAGWKNIDPSIESIDTQQFPFIKSVSLWENQDENGLYSVTTRPVVLAIGDFKKGFYDHVFRAANLGALPYDNAWIVEGTKNIDDYSLNELRQFNGLILHGYGYRFWNKSGVWKMIHQYVEQGGNVFVDTGWQYIAKDWGSISGESGTPEPLPVSKVSWGDIGMTWENAEVNKSYIRGVDLANFDPPVWDGNPWGMSLGDEGSLRENSTPILSKGGKVIIALRQIGKGKLLWSGMNLLSHVTKNMNGQEAKFLSGLFMPLFSTGNVIDNAVVRYARDYPDIALFTFETGNRRPVWLLFRESYSPYWHAAFTQSDKTISLPVYRAGPGFVLVRLPSVNPGDTVQLNARLGLADGLLAKNLSIIILIGLILYIPFGGKLFFGSLMLTNLKAGGYLKGIISSRLKNLTADEEDY